MRDLDAPLGWYATRALPPLGSGMFAGAKIGGNVIYQAPGERTFGHDNPIGLSVQGSQDYMSQDRWTRRNYYSGMANDNEEAMFNEALISRVHRLRNERGWSAAQMATALGIPAERYRKYEYRTPLPHYLMERFALIVGRDLEYVLLGRQAPSRIEQAESRRKRA